MITAQSSLAQVWTLQQCMDTALVNNKNLQISRNSIQIGEQKHKEAQANLIPKINVNADYRYFTDLPYQLMPLSVFGGPEGEFKEARFGVPHNIIANLQMTMPLYNPQLYGAIRTTRIASDISIIQSQKSEEQIIFEISNLFFNIQILENQLAFLDSNISNSKRLLSNMKLLREQLLANGTDVSKVQLQLDQLTTHRELVRSKNEQVLNALKFTMGISPEQSIEIDPAIQYHSINMAYNSTPTPDIRLTETQIRLLAGEIRTLKNSRLPSLSLYGAYGTTGFGYDKTPNEFFKFFPVGYAGAQLSYPLFNGTITKRKINQKKLELKNSELQLGLVTEQNNMMIKNAQQQRNAAQFSVETSLSQITLGKSVYDQTLLQQKQGAASLTEVLLANNTLREAQQNYLTAVVEYLKADLELRKLTGNILNKQQ
ncbi:MAG: TolC family protein [Bacteroidales bacterium]|nr:TolC family protein [Bacteroidales bacterium]